MKFLKVMINVAVLSLNQTVQLKPALYLEHVGNKCNLNCRRLCQNVQKLFYYFKKLPRHSFCL